MDFPGLSGKQFRVQSLVWEDPLEKEMAIQYSCLGNPTAQRSLVGYSPWGRKEWK